MQFVAHSGPRLDIGLLLPLLRRRHLSPPFENRPTYYFPLARNGIYHGLRALGISHGDTVLVPSFHCATAVYPILRCGANVKFFNIHRDFSPDFDDLEAKIDSKVRAVLAIHYFGFPQPIHKFLALCRAHNLSLIEDCAHVLTGEVDGTILGTVGDISVFSWRKFLPLFDGGQLVINNPKIHVNIPWEGHFPLSPMEVIRKVFSDLIYGSSVKTIKGMSHLLQFLRSVGGRVRSKGKPHSLGQGFDFSLVNLRISRASGYILRNADIPDIVRKRRRNCISLLKAFESISEITPLFPTLPRGICPWLLPILNERRLDFRETLRSNGIPAFTWRDVPHPKLKLEEFPDANFLYEKLVLLPVSQSISNSEMQTVIDLIGQALFREK